MIAIKVILQVVRTVKTFFSEKKNNKDNYRYRVIQNICFNFSGYAKDYNLT